MPDVQELFGQAMNDMSGWLSDFFANNFFTIVLSILLAIGAFLVGRWIAKWLARLAARWLTRSHIDPTASHFLSRAIYIFLLGLVLIASLSILGIPMTSFIAVLGASVLAIGLALQDSLSNLASGLLVIILKPYVVKDIVELGEDRVSGQVESVEFFHTALRTPDNSLLLVPNAEVMSNPILNFTEMQWRRVDLEFGIGYSDDLLKAKRILEAIAREDDRVLDDPPLRVAVKDLGENSVNLVMQPYVHPADYLATRFDLTERVKLRFDEEGISFPFPQRTIYVIPPEPGADLPATPSG